MKRLFICLAIACVLCSFWVYQLCWGRPARFNLFVERVLIQQALADPELLTYLGVVDNGPFDFYSGKLTDISLEKNNACLEQMRSSLATLHAYDRSRLVAQDQLTYDILELYLQSILEKASFGYGSNLNSFSIDATPYPVNQLFGMQNSMPDFMVNIHRLIDEKSAQRYIERLSQWDKKFTDLIAELKLREANGVIPPDFVIGKVLNELHQFVQVPAAENMLYTALQNKLPNLKLSQPTQDKLQKNALNAIETKVYPAYLKLIAFLEEQKSRAVSDAGVWKFPNGDAYYAFCLRYHTTTNKSPEQVHALGLSEVSRIQNEMRLNADKLGYRELSVKEAMRTLGRDPRFLYPNTDEGRKQVLVDVQGLYDQIQDQMRQLFSKFPKAELKIDAVPDFKAKTAPIAYYEPGDLKGTRAGVFYVNTHDMRNQTKFTMPSLAYHEGIPGHHFQIARAQEIQNVPTFRKVVPFTAYQEGWALYCEQLAAEYRFTSNPYAELGRLQMELMRAVRLVVDTGIHHKRWSREQAIGYMMEMTGQNESEVTNEIERYIVLPGQACSYKIGMIKILELREVMKQRLGADFDIKVFHELVLQNGAMPLTLLQNHIEAYLQQTAGLVTMTLR